MNFQMFKLDLEKAETRDHIANIHWIIEKEREFQKNIYFCFIDYAKGFGLINEAVDVFLECSCFFDDSLDVGNLISGSSAFSKSSLHLEVHGSRTVEAWLGGF